MGLVMGAGDMSFLIITLGTMVAHELLFAGLLGAAAVIDARTRRLPNALAAALVLAAALCAVMPGVWQGIMVEPETRTALDALRDLGWHLIVAIAVSVVLVVFELAWRAARGRPGLGMGDIKLLFALTLADPLRGIIAFAGGLGLLAVGCLVARKGSLPLIPFVFPVWIASTLFGAAGLLA